MKIRVALLGITALLLAGSIAAARAAQEVAPISALDAATVSTPASSDCSKATDFLAPMLASGDVNPHCGTCGHPACSGADFGAYCGRRSDPFGSPFQYVSLYCQPTQACTGEGIGMRRCVCVAEGNILP